MEMSDQFHGPATSLLDSAPSTHWIGGWVGLRDSLDAVEKRKILLDFIIVIVGQLQPPDISSLLDPNILLKQAQSVKNMSVVCGGVCP
jgi:hypothetical protein